LVVTTTNVAESNNVTGLPDFSWSKHTKMGRIYQIATNYNKQPKIIPNGHKIFQMGTKYTNIFHSKALQNLPKLGFFGLKINRLATLQCKRRLNIPDNLITFFSNVSSRQ
jgi:hypothetical protein